MLRQKLAASSFVRKMWLDESSLPKEVKLQLSLCPYLSDLWMTKVPSKIHKCSANSLTSLLMIYHQKKYLQKVSVPSSAPKRPPPAQKEPVETKKFIMDAKKGSTSSSRPKRGGRGRGSRYASRNDSKKTASQGRGEKKGF